MLVLSRKKDGKIMIGDNIVITVVELENNKVKIGIDAPESIEIHREEVYKEIAKENQDAVLRGKNIDLDILKDYKKGKED